MSTHHTRLARPDHSPPRQRWVALALGALLACATAQAQQTVTQWQFDAQLLDHEGIVDTLGGSGLGPGSFQAKGTPAGDIGFTSFAAVAPGSANLKASVDLRLDQNEINGVRMIGQSAATHSDVFTVSADPSFAGGQLRFVYALEGRMYGLLLGERDPIFAMYWDFYQSADLFVTGPTVPRTTLVKHAIEFSGVHVPDTAKNFTDYMAFDLDTNPGFSVVGNDQYLVQQSVPPAAGGSSVAVDVTPGLPVAVDFHLHTGVNVLMFNEDAHQVLSFNHGMEFSQTATLQGVQLLDAGGNPYAGEWSLASASGIDYTLLPVPEPGTWALWLAGLGLLGGLGGLGGLGARGRR